MRRTVARGRIYPQSYSTDARIGRLSLKAIALFPLMWANADDQGRLTGDTDEIKYAVCPNIDPITKTDIPGILKELEDQNLIKVYTSSKSKAMQLLDWWDVEKLQWAYPSQYLAPPGWKDRLRYHATPKEVITENWLSPSQPDKATASASPDDSPALSGSQAAISSANQPQTEKGSEKRVEKEEEIEEGNRRGRGISPSALGSPSPAPVVDSFYLLDSLKENFQEAFGRDPDSREQAQLRDLAKGISSAGGATAQQLHDAFKEAAIHSKPHISYVRAVLLEWLGVTRDRSP